MPTDRILELLKAQQRISNVRKIGPSSYVDNLLLEAQGKIVAAIKELEIAAETKEARNP